MLCTMFGLIWLGGSREVKNVKSLKTDGRAEGRRTTGDEKSSLAP